MADVLLSVLDASLRSTVLLGLVAAAAWLWRSGPAAGRHRLWLVGLTGMLLMPLVTRGAPRWNVRVEGVPPVGTGDDLLAHGGRHDFRARERHALLVDDSPTGDARGALHPQQHVGRCRPAIGEQPSAERPAPQLFVAAHFGHSSACRAKLCSGFAITTCIKTRS